MATDGDADRIGAMDERGNFVDPHKIMALSIKHLVEKRGMSGAVVRTVSSTRMIDRLAKKNGLRVYETPVGVEVRVAGRRFTVDRKGIVTKWKD